MGGLNPESWPILAAFLVLQSVITLPLVAYIRKSHEAQLAEMIKQIDAGTKACDDRIADQKAQTAALVLAYATATEYAQRRGDLLHAEKEKLVAQLDANSQQIFRAVDALGELREAVRDLTKARRTS